MHARKTRERKKQQSTTLQTRIGELQDEVISASLNCAEVISPSLGVKNPSHASITSIQKINRSNLLALSTFTEESICLICGQLITNQLK